MTRMDSGLKKIGFSQEKCEGKRTFLVTWDSTRLVPSRVTSKEGSNNSQPRTRLRHTAGLEPCVWASEACDPPVANTGWHTA